LAQNLVQCGDLEDMFGGMPVGLSTPSQLCWWNRS
jgi:hypothetical protein